MKITENHPVAKLCSLASLTEVLFTREQVLTPALTPKFVRIRMCQRTGGETSSSHSQQTHGKLIHPVRSPRLPDTHAIQMEDQANDFLSPSRKKRLLTYSWAVSSCSFPQITCVHFCSRPYQQDKRCTYHNQETSP